MKNPEEHKRHLDTKRKINGMNDIHEFEALLSKVKLSEVEKQILRFVYVEQLTMIDIGDKLGFSEQCVKKKHKKALAKIATMI